LASYLKNKNVNKVYSKKCLAAQIREEPLLNISINVPIEDIRCWQKRIILAGNQFYHWPLERKSNGRGVD